MWTAQPIRGQDDNSSDQWGGSIQRVLTFSEIDSKTMWILKFVWKNSKIETTQKYLEVLNNLFRRHILLLNYSSAINNSSSLKLFNIKIKHFCSFVEFYTLTIFEYVNWLSTQNQALLPINTTISQITSHQAKITHNLIIQNVLRGAGFQCCVEI